MDSKSSVEYLLNFGKEFECLKEKIIVSNKIFEELSNNFPKETEYLFLNWGYEQALKFILHFINYKDLNKELIEFVDSVDYRLD